MRDRSDVASFACANSLFSMETQCKHAQNRKWRRGNAPRWRKLNFFECSKRTAGHVTRIYQSYLQDLLLVERSAKLKMEEQLIILVQGYLQLYDLSGSHYFDTNRDWTMPGDISADDTLFLQYVMFICTSSSGYLAMAGMTLVQPAKHLGQRMRAAGVFHTFLDATSERPLTQTEYWKSNLQVGDSSESMCRNMM